MAEFLREFIGYLKYENEDYENRVLSDVRQLNITGLWTYLVTGSKTKYPTSKRLEFLQISTNEPFPNK